MTRAISNQLRQKQTQKKTSSCLCCATFNKLISFGTKSIKLSSLIQCALGQTSVKFATGTFRAIYIIWTVETCGSLKPQVVVVVVVVLRQSKTSSQRVYRTSKFSPRKSPQKNANYSNCFWKFRKIYFVQYIWFYFALFRIVPTKFALSIENNAK